MKELLENAQNKIKIKNNESIGLQEAVKIASENKESMQIANNRKVITDLKASKEELRAASEDLWEQIGKNNKNLDYGIEESKKLVSKSKDMANQMSDQLLRVSKLLGDGFENRIIQLERVTACLEKLEQITKNEKMAAIIKSIGDK